LSKEPVHEDPRRPGICPQAMHHSRYWENSVALGFSRREASASLRTLAFWWGRRFRLPRGFSFALSAAFTVGLAGAECVAPLAEFYHK
jgi:hypothetical protein